MANEYYNGWKISEFSEILWNSKIPYSSEKYYVACRYGVAMNHKDKNSLKRMIDTKNKLMRQFTNLEKGLV